MKKKLITILMSAAIVACLAGFVSCGKLGAPEQAHKNGNVVRVNYDTNGGIIGGGGLGDLAIRYGYQRFRPDVMAASVVVIIIMVEVIQFIGTRIANKMLANR